MTQADRKNQRFCFREKILMVGQIWRDEQWVEASILDISPYGARICSTEELPAVARLKVKVDGIGELSATVTWHNHDEMGISFEDDPDCLERRLKEYLARITRIHKLYETGD